MGRRIPEATRQRILDAYEAERLERGVEYGYCFCGCNRPTLNAPSTCASKTMLKGHPQRFIRDHHQLHPAHIIQDIRERYEAERLERGIAWGECFCGCGKKAPLAKQTDLRRCNSIQGHPHKTIQHHQPSYTGPLYLEVDMGYKTPCWIWQRGLRGGYGAIRQGEHTPFAHRVFYERTKGPIPPGFQLDHVCMSSTYGKTGSTACVRPDHLEPLTPAQHKRRAVSTKVTEGDVRKIRRLLASTQMSQNAIGEKFGVSRGCIKNIAEGKTWRDVTL